MSVPGLARSRYQGAGTMNSRHSLSLAVAMLIASVTAPLSAADPAPAPQHKPMPGPGPMQPDMAIDPAQRSQILQQLIANLDSHYVFPDKAKAMAADLRAREARGEYAKITSAQAFAKKLTDDVRSVTRDLHMSVKYSAQPVPPQALFDSEEPSPQDLEMERRLNFGIERVQRMDFNLGYLDLRAFVPSSRAAPKLAAAMTLLADTDGLVIDLRNNGGGDPATVALLGSYLFDQRTHLNDIYDRVKDSTEEFWTLDTLAGRKYGGRKPVYVLVSKDTFSGGEDLAYTLQALKRATIVGATTGGGAHPVGPRRLNDHFVAMIPTARAINPVTRTNWEGVGVVPDIAIDREKALDKATTLYLADVLKTEKNEGRRQFITQKLAELELALERAPAEPSL
jgi:hypothetical protein